MASLHNSPYVMNSFLEQFPELVIGKGGNFQALCESVELPVDMATGRHQLIPFDKFIALLEAAEQELNYPEIAFELARRQSIDAMGPVSQLISSCQFYGEALLKILQYLEVLTSGFNIRLQNSEHLLEICFDIFVPNLHMKRQFQNYLLAGSVSILRKTIKTKHPLRACFFTQQENDSRLRKIHNEFFGCPVAFGAESIKVTMDNAVLREPIAFTSPTMFREILGLYPSPDALEDAIRKSITLSLAGGELSLKAIGQSMGYGERTFRRRLSEAKLSFSQILSAVRFEHANRYLQSTHYKLGDVAALLGYANQSAFTRSYSKWCGMTPSDYRQSLRKPA